MPDRQWAKPAPRQIIQMSVDSDAGCHWALAIVDDPERPRSHYAAPRLDGAFEVFGVDGDLHTSAILMAGAEVSYKASRSPPRAGLWRRLGPDDIQAIQGVCEQLLDQPADPCQQLHELRQMASVGQVAMGQEAAALKAAAARYTALARDQRVLKTLEAAVAPPLLCGRTLEADVAEAVHAALARRGTVTPVAGPQMVLKEVAAVVAPTPPVRPVGEGDVAHQFLRCREQLEEAHGVAVVQEEGQERGSLLAGSEEGQGQCWRARLACGLLALHHGCSHVHVGDASELPHPVRMAALRCGGRNGVPLIRVLVWECGPSFWASTNIKMYVSQMHAHTCMHTHMHPDPNPNPPTS